MLVTRATNSLVREAARQVARLQQVGRHAVGRLHRQRSAVLHQRQLLATAERGIEACQGIVVCRNATGQTDQTDLKVEACLCTVAHTRWVRMHAAKPYVRVVTVMGVVENEEALYRPGTTWYDRMDCSRAGCAASCAIVVLRPEGARAAVKALCTRGREPQRGKVSVGAAGQSKAGQGNACSRARFAT